jgi:CRISPR-associated protein Csb1
LGAKFARVICSEIVGFSAEVGNRAANRIDPFGIEKASAVIYEADTDLGWTIDESKARKEGSKAKKFQRGAAGEAGRPSIINYGNIITDIQPGGATMDRALQTTVVSLAGLRKLFFPDQDGKQGQERDTAARAYLATLALAAILWQQERYGYDLRSRCVLRPKKRTMALVPNAPGRDDEPLELTLEEALELYQEASAALKAARFDWDPTRTLTLKPDDQVVEMVKLNLQMRGRGEAE